MTVKKEIFEYIKNLAEQNDITLKELIAAYRSGAKDTHEKIRMVGFLYYLGGAIALLGMFILVYQHWNALGFAIKVLATLGFGIAIYLAAFLVRWTSQRLSNIFYIISALAIAMGLGVVFDHGFHFKVEELTSLISIILFVIYMCSYFLLRKNVLLLVAVLAESAFFVSFINALSLYYQFFSLFNLFDILQYCSLIIGITYLMLGYAFSGTQRASLSNFFNCLGVILFLITAFQLGGWKPHVIQFWEFSYPIWVAGGIYLGIWIKNQSCIIWSILFLIVYILKISAEYFSNSLGWPLTISMAGIIIIGIVYMYLSLLSKWTKLKN